MPPCQEPGPSPLQGATIQRLMHHLIPRLIANSARASTAVRQYMHLPCGVAHRWMSRSKAHRLEQHNVIKNTFKNICVPPCQEPGPSPLQGATIQQLFLPSAGCEWGGWGGVWCVGGVGFPAFSGDFAPTPPTITSLLHYVITSLLR